LAGEQAFDAAAFEDALRHHENAISLQPSDDRKGRADLLHKRGLALRSLGRWDEALAGWLQALDAYEELGDTEAVGRLGYQLSWQLAWAARNEEAVEIARRGLSALGERTSADRCRLLAVAGANLSLGGDYPAADPMLAQALAIAEELGDQRLLGEVLFEKAAHHFGYAEAREAAEAGRRAAELLRSSGALWELADTLWVTQQAMLYLGRFDEVAKIGEELEPLAARLGHLGALVMAGRCRGFRECFLTADIARFEEFARDDLQLCRSIGLPWVSNSYTFLGGAHFWRGRWEEALESFQEGARLEPSGWSTGIDWADLFLGKAYIGEKPSTLAMLEERRASLPQPGQANTLGSWEMLITAVEGLAVLGERDEAAKLYPLVL